jgi:putative transposase
LKIANTENNLCWCGGVLDGHPLVFFLKFIYNIFEKLIYYIMATKKRIFCNREFYHIVLKGVDGKSLFLDNKDRYRMIHNMFVFNDSKDCVSTIRHCKNLTKKIEKYCRQNLVVIHAFCLMSNHIHLMLEQKKENGISRFMLKLGAGYASYFNAKYNRTGHLFQGRFKSV